MTKKPTRLRFTEEELADPQIQKAAEQAAAYQAIQEKKF